MVIASALLIGSCKKNKPLIVRFQNPLSIDRVNEVVTIPYNSFSIEASDLPMGNLPLFLDGNDTLTSQNIDLNADGIPEEILVEISIKAGSYKDLKISFISKTLFPVFAPKTNIHFALKESPQAELDSANRIQTKDTKITASVFQFEGPGWENDKVGFRNYYDLRNGMDIFGKKSDALVLDSIGLGQHSYHLMSNWGMDILKVGNSLGAGAIGIEKDGIFYRIGDNGFSAFERLFEGPLKSEFAFHFSNWTANKHSSDLIQYVSITAGLYSYETEIFADFPDDSYNLITGIVNKHSDSLIFENSCADHILMATHSIQSEDTAYLGMALLIPRNLFKSHGETPKTGDGITETYFARISANMSEPAKYYFYSGWATGNPIFATKEGFINLIKEDALKLENPIRIQKIKTP